MNYQKINKNIYKCLIEPGDSTRYEFLTFYFNDEYNKRYFVVGLNEIKYPNYISYFEIPTESIINENSTDLSKNDFYIDIAKRKECNVFTFIAIIKAIQEIEKILVV